MGISAGLSRLVSPCKSFHWGTCFVVGTPVVCGLAEDQVAVTADPTDPDNAWSVTWLAVAGGCAAGALVVQWRVRKTLKEKEHEDRQQRRRINDRLAKTFANWDCDLTALPEPAEHNGGSAASVPVEVQEKTRVAESRATGHRRSLPFATWASGLLLVLAGLCWYQAAPRNPSSPVLALPAQAAALPVRTLPTLVTKPIEDVPIGQRLRGRNPHRHEVDLIEPDEATWLLLRLRMDKEDRRLLWIEMIRPADWVLAVEAWPDESIWLDLPELGAVGVADVLEMEPCPPIEPGDGPVVTARFIHETDGSNIIGLQLEGQPEPTGVTTNHRYWSVTRNDFIPAGELKVGELLDTEFGPRRLAAIVPVKYEGYVYNLETTEHVYRVGHAGELVHNVYYDLHHTIPREIRKSRRTGKTLLTDELMEKADIVGRPGNPNRWSFPRDVHRQIHSKKRPGGDYNSKWKKELEKLEIEKPNRNEWTVEDILAIRDKLVKDFGLEQYRPH